MKKLTLKGEEGARQAVALGLLGKKVKVKTSLGLLNDELIDICHNAKYCFETYCGFYNEIVIEAPKLSELPDGSILMKNGIPNQIKDSSESDLYVWKNLFDLGKYMNSKIVECANGTERLYLGPFCPPIEIDLEN